VVDDVRGSNTAMPNNRLQWPGSGSVFFLCLVGRWITAVPLSLAGGIVPNGR